MLEVGVLCSCPQLCFPLSPCDRLCLQDAGLQRPPGCPGSCQICASCDLQSARVQRKRLSERLLGLTEDLLHAGAK